MFIFVVFILLFSSGCSGQPGVVSGSELWQGIWSSDKTTARGKIEFAIQRSNTALFGNIVITGSPVTKGGEIIGTIEGDKLEFGLIKDRKGKLKYSGTISEDAMSGTWQIPTIDDYGTWQATKGNARVAQAKTDI